MKWRESSCCARVTEEDVLCFRESVGEVRQMERPFCCGNAIIVHFPRISHAIPAEFQAEWHAPRWFPQRLPPLLPHQSPHWSPQRILQRPRFQVCAVQWTTQAQRRLQDARQFTVAHATIRQAVDKVVRRVRSGCVVAVAAPSCRTGCGVVAVIAVGSENEPRRWTK